ncbi:MAG: GNAT family N-acetyltransferase [Sphingorhabdus sp.]
MSEVIAETDRLILRTEAPGDLDRWMEAMNTPAVTKHLGGVVERDEIKARFARKAAGIAKDGYGFWHVQTKVDGLLIGHCGLAPIETIGAGLILSAALQIGWSITESHWRQGYAIEAAHAVLALAFNRFDQNVVYAQTSEANRASWMMMQKLGMERAAELDYVDPDYPPEENPTIIYKLSRERWKAMYA